MAGRDPRRPSIQKAQQRNSFSSNGRFQMNENFYATMDGTGANIDIKCGFIPAYVKSR
jgi:hypothetical protein